MSEETSGDPQSKHSLPNELRGQPPEAAAAPERRDTRPPQTPPPSQAPPAAWQFPNAGTAEAYPTPPPAAQFPASGADPEVTANVPRNLGREQEPFASREAREPYRATPDGQSAGAFQQAPSAAPWSAGAPPRPAGGPAPRSDALFGTEFMAGMGAPSAPQPVAAPAPVVGLGGSLSRELRQERFTTAVKPQPRSGWRRALLRSTFGADIDLVVGDAFFVESLVGGIALDAIGFGVHRDSHDLIPFRMRWFTLSFKNSA